MEEFAKKHLQINSFGNGDLWEVIEKSNTSKSFDDFTYPLLWAQDGSVGFGDNINTFSFQMLAMDQTLNGEVNENFVKSSMVEILNDFVSYFRKTKFTDVEGNRLSFKFSATSADSYTERFNDILTGYNLQVTFTIPNAPNACKIPFK